MSRALVLLIAVVAAACGDDGKSGGDAGGSGGGSGVVDAGPVSSCDPPGHFGGAPAETFDLPVSAPGQLAYNDVQASFPDVHWDTIDRLYLPAGQYTNLMLGNLPARSASRPLVITNKGGQVVVGFNPHGNYIWSMTGGANWVLTGRYDAMSQTGDAAFAGHACGAYANSAGTYGIVSDDDYAFAAPYLHMGIAVTNATDFEIEYVEVKRSGFAGIRLLNDAAMLGNDKPMANVRMHDVYIHDTGAEGFYFGWTGTPPSNKFPHLEIYNCRILRAGNEALQIQDLGDGTHVHHNTFVSGGLHWLDNGLGKYQDNLTQMLVREGEIEVDHNVFIDGAGTLLNFFSSPEDGDGARHVTFHDNYWSDAIDLGGYLNGTADAQSSFTFRNETFRNIVFGYTPVDATAKDPGVVFGHNPPVMAPITFDGNHEDGTKPLMATGANVVLTGNAMDAPPAIAFVGSGTDALWSSAGKHLTAWAPVATVASDKPTVQYHAGDLVTDGDAPTLYRCTADSASEEPSATPAKWTALPAPSDDVRVAPGSPYAGYGVQ